jgi:tRNA(adenine34) deaminase
MALAIAEARRAAAEGNSAVGTILVANGEVLAVGRNLVNTSGDPTAHAEMVAIRAAAAAHGRLDFIGATLYTTFEPCPMCAGAIIWANVSRLVIGSRYATFQLRGSYRVETLCRLVGSALEIQPGVMETECDDLMHL